MRSLLEENALILMEAVLVEHGVDMDLVLFLAFSEWPLERRLRQSQRPGGGG